MDPRMAKRPVTATIYFTLESLNEEILLVASQLFVYEQGRVHYMNGENTKKSLQKRPTSNLNALC